MEESDLTPNIAAARAIRESGRWAEVNECLIALCANPGEGDAWFVKMICALCDHAFSNYLALCAAFEQSPGDSALLAWRARNLLELSVWAIFCTQNDENAIEFCGEPGQDFMNLVRALHKWGVATNQGGEWSQTYEDAAKAISDQAASQGVTGLDGSLKAVSDAAREIGMEHHFRANNKLLSKFAHPTAMLIMMPPNAGNAASADTFLGMGCVFSLGAFNALELWLLNNT